MSDTPFLDLVEGGGPILPRVSPIKEWLWYELLGFDYPYEWSDAERQAFLYYSHGLRPQTHGAG